jgi:hypothetical protein
VSRCANAPFSVGNFIVVESFSDVVLLEVELGKLLNLRGQ